MTQVLIFFLSDVAAQMPFALHLPDISFSVVMQTQSQHHRKPDPENESEALQEPQVALLVGLGSVVRLEVGG